MAVVPEGMPEVMDWRGGIFIPGGGEGKLEGIGTVVTVGAADPDAALEDAVTELDEADACEDAAEDGDELDTAWRALRLRARRWWLLCALAPTRRAERTTRASSFILVVS